ncbi:MAG TPA: YncE family protein [Nitrosopumilaceae archaeon]|nr:YncE family protein [Nitrosopumilaceae archaeon]
MDKRIISEVSILVLLIMVSAASITVGSAVKSYAQLASNYAISDTIKISEGTCAIAVNPYSDIIYVTNPIASRISAINGTTNSMITSFPAGSIPCGIAVNPDTDVIYVTSENSNMLYVIDSSTKLIKGTIDVIHPYEIAVNSKTNKVYVTSDIANKLYVIDGLTNNVLTILDISQPCGVAVNDHKNKVYVTSEDTNSLYVIDGSFDKVLHKIDVGTIPRGVAVNADTNMIYVTNQGSNTLSVIDGSKDILANTINVGKSPLRIAVNPTNNTIYVTNLSSNTLSVIDGFTNKVNTLTVQQPYELAVNSKTDKAYVTDQLTNTVYVIERSAIKPSLHPVQVPKNAPVDLSKDPSKIKYKNSYPHTDWLASGIYLLYRTEYQFNTDKVDPMDWKFKYTINDTNGHAKSELLWVNIPDNAPGGHNELVNSLLADGGNILGDALWLGKSKFEEIKQGKENKVMEDIMKIDNMTLPVYKINITHSLGNSSLVIDKHTGIIVNLNFKNDQYTLRMNLLETNANTELSSVMKSLSLLDQLKTKSVEAAQKDSSQNTTGTATAPFDSTHEHAALKVFINGKAIDFSQPKYQLKSRYIHFENGDGTTVHRHAKGVDLGLLFETIGIKFTSDCFIMDDGTKYCNDSKHALKFFVNGAQNNMYNKYVIKSGDRILISYPSNGPDEIKQLNIVKNLTIAR